MWGTLCGKGGWLMTVRERTEEIERITLSPFATLSENSPVSYTHLTLPTTSRV